MSARLWTTVIALALLSLPLMAGAQEDGAQEDRDRKTSTVTFYGHVFGHGLGLPMPANTQFPSGENNYGIGGAVECVDPVERACEDEGSNMLALYSTAGFVQVSDRHEFTAEGGYAKLHNEHGNTKDVVLDTTQPILASVFLSLDAHSWFVGGGAETDCLLPHPRDAPCLYPSWGWDPGAFPDFYVKASLYHAILGEYGSSASEQPQLRPALDSGEATLIAEGVLYNPMVMNGIPGNPNVHEFTIDLGPPQVGTIPKEADFFILFKFYHETNGVQWNGGNFRVWSGEFFPVRFTMPVKNAYDVEQVVPQFIHSRLAILATLNTPWGSYDINPEATRLTITDESGKEVTPVRLETLADYRVAHGAHYKPVNVTFVWDYLADGLAPGRYSVSVEGANHQGSARGSCTAGFTIGASGRPAGVEPGACGQRTTEAFLNQAPADDDSPDASPGSLLVGRRPTPLVH